MGREVKRGLDYFPVDVDMYSDIRIRKLIRRCGGVAVSVYLATLGIIYREGYYTECDEDLPFIVSELTGLGEEDVQGVIRQCVAVRLFDARMFEEHAILTSSGIQKRFLRICEQSRRRARVAEYSLLDETADRISSEEKGINAEEKGISSVKKGINAEEMTSDDAESGISSVKMPQIKEKEIKEKENKTLPQTPSRGQSAVEPPEREDFEIERFLRSVYADRQQQVLGLTAEAYAAYARQVAREWDSTGRGGGTIAGKAPHMLNHIRRKMEATSVKTSRPAKESAALEQRRLEKERKREEAEREEAEREARRKATGLTELQQYFVARGLPKDTNMAEYARRQACEATKLAI